MSTHILRSSFNAGEISPLMDSRVDAEKYPFSCRRLENFIPQIYGGAFRRPGMVYLGSVGDDTAQVMLIPFAVSADVRYMIEMGDEYARIWNSDGTLVVDEADATVELTTPYTAAELFSVKVVQLNNVCFFAHPSHEPQKLTRAYDVDDEIFAFTWEALTLDYPVFRSTNQSAITATPSATSGTGTISFSANIFNEADNYTIYEGARIQLTQRRSASLVELGLDATGTSQELWVLGDFEMTTYGTWDGTLTIEREDSAGNWQEIKTFSSDEDRNISYVATQIEPASLRLNYIEVGSETGSPRAVLEVADSRRSGIATIDEINIVSDLPVVSVTINEAFDSTGATTEWALEAWGDYSGYPRAIAFHEQRLWFGGTAIEPNTFWGSRTDDFVNFRRGSYDSDALAFTLAAQEGSAIQTMLSHEALILFTQTEEWTATTSEQTAITPSNIFVRRQSRFGSAYLQSFIANNNILFLQRGSRKLREFRYTVSEAGGSSSDLSLLAEHITRGGVKQIAYQQQPDPVVWIVTNNGELVSMTFESDQNVIAWAKHPTDGTVESVAVIYGDAADSADDVWFIVNRENGRFVERFHPTASGDLESGDIDSMIYLDSAVEITNGSPSTSVAGLDHLEGETVSVIADNVVLDDVEVSSGGFTLDTAASRVVAGYRYTSLLQPSRVEIPMDDGTGQARKWVCKRIGLNLYQTSGLEYADTPEAIELNWHDLPGDLIGAGELYTGEVSVNNLGAHSGAVNVAIRQRDPLPCNVLSMVIKCDVQGK